MKIGGKRRGIWTRGERTMTTREEALNFGLSFPNTYQRAPSVSYTHLDVYKRQAYEHGR